MLRRCRDQNNPYYGGREPPVPVCERWHSFENFYADMGDPPDGLSIHRVDGSRGYSPSNCEWATPAEQAANRRPPKRKRRRATIAEINVYRDALARAASASGGNIGAP
jgi:hypothetical protein